MLISCELAETLYAPYSPKRVNMCAGVWGPDLCCHGLPSVGKSMKCTENRAPLGQFTSAQISNCFVTTIFSQLCQMRSEGTNVHLQYSGHPGDRGCWPNVACLRNRNYERIRPQRCFDYVIKPSRSGRKWPAGGSDRGPWGEFASSESYTHWLQFFRNSNCAVPVPEFQ